MHHNVIISIALQNYMYEVLVTGSDEMSLTSKQLLVSTSTVPAVTPVNSSGIQSLKYSHV